jgi:hypothetical protein
VTLQTADGRIGEVVGEQRLPHGTRWLLRVHWGHGFHSWIRLHDGRLPRQYLERVTSNSIWKACLQDCIDCNRPTDYFGKTAAVRAYMLSEIKANQRRN